MPCPFPGMDPYIEASERWRDFHNMLIAQIQIALKPLLAPRYAAVGDDRLYVVQSNRSIYPDVAVTQRSTEAKKKSSPSALLEMDVPRVFELWQEEVRQPFVKIIEPR